MPSATKAENSCHYDAQTTHHDDTEALGNQQNTQEGSSSTVPNSGSGNRTGEGLVIGNWKAAVSRSTGKIYFFDISRGVSSYEPPSELSSNEIEHLKRAATAPQSDVQSARGSGGGSTSTATKELPKLRALPPQTPEARQQQAIKLFKRVVKDRCQEVLEGKAGHGSRYSARSDEKLQYVLNNFSVDSAYRRTKETADCEVIDTEKLKDPLVLCGIGTDIIVCMGLNTSVATMWCGRWTGQASFPRDGYILRMPPTDKFWRYYIHDEAEALGLLTRSEGAGDQRHVIIFHPDHPPPEQQEEDEEEKLREAEAEKIRKQQEELAQKAKERRKYQKQDALKAKEAMNEHAREAETLQPMFPRRDKRSVSQIQKELREKKRARDRLSDQYDGV
eukprot:gb/GECG01013721.1/.p1 GENE.gb/GECG01013721.1/~~gb/GECG01013721.1/.p1  ORF type:complete len:390 (+),score=65.90 gb/GECG01013721.1/:1-1170(+)